MPIILALGRRELGVRGQLRYTELMSQSTTQKKQSVLWLHITGRGTRGKKKWRRAQWEATVMVRREVKKAGKLAEGAEVRATRPCVCVHTCMRACVCVRVKGKEAVNSVVWNESLPLLSLHVFVHIRACTAGLLYVSSACQSSPLSFFATGCPLTL